MQWKQEIRQIYTSKTIWDQVGVENYAKVGGQRTCSEWSSPKLAAIKNQLVKGIPVSNWKYVLILKNKTLDKILCFTIVF